MVEFSDRIAILQKDARKFETTDDKRAQHVATENLRLNNI